MLAHAAIRQAFAAYFSGTVTLPQAPLAVRGQVTMARWSVNYLLSESDGRPCLDFYATNRFTNDRHVRIHEDGRLEHLDAPLELFIHDPKVPGDRERAERAYFEHNRRIYELLRSKGLL
ncbi:MAG TPA: hypothetical protein VI197_12295 [Polyangiaceae bacterium]